MLVKTILKTLDIPKCESKTRRNKLPPLYGKDGLTDFPNKDEDLAISFKNSKFALFPLDVAVGIARDYPEVWCRSGNWFGNHAFEYWLQTTLALERGQPVPDKCLRWIKKRERYIARHRQDFRVKGVIAMIKWAGFVDADIDGATTGDSLRYMLDLIER